MRRPGWTSLTRTFAEAWYISHSHVSSASSAILPELLVNQNLVVTDGSAIASKTSCGGRRISMPTSTDGALVSCSVTVITPSVPDSAAPRGHCDRLRDDRTHELAGAGSLIIAGHLDGAQVGV